MLYLPDVLYTNSCKSDEGKGLGLTCKPELSTNQVLLSDILFSIINLLWCACLKSIEFCYLSLFMFLQRIDQFRPVVQDGTEDNKVNIVNIAIAYAHFMVYYSPVICHWIRPAMQMVSCMSIFQNLSCPFPFVSVKNWN